MAGAGFGGGPGDDVAAGGATGLRWPAGRGPDYAQGAGRDSPNLGVETGGQRREGLGDNGEILLVEQGVPGRHLVASR